MSDGGALAFMVTEHHTFKTAVEAAAAALHATVDINSGNTYTAANIKEAYTKGMVTQAELIPALQRLFTKRFEVGLFDKTVYDDLTASVDVDTAEHRAFARQAAADAIVLLKNADDFLPLALPAATTTTDGAGDGSIALIGPNADSKAALVGGYPGCVVNPENNLYNWTDWPFMINPECKLITPLAGFQNVTQSIRYAVGSPIMSEDRSGFVEAVAASQASSVAVVVLGLRSCALDKVYPGPIHGSDDCQEDEAHDRNTTDLPAIQIELLRVLLQTSVSSNITAANKVVLPSDQSAGTPIVLVVMSGSAVSLPADIVEHPQIKAIAWTSYSGEEAGNGLTDVVFGSVSPAGRLPFTFPTGVHALPPYLNMDMSHPPGRTYKYLTDRATNQQWPFGYGLSYLTFTYSEFTLSATKIPATSPLSTQIEACAVVSATGRSHLRAREVVQVYASKVVALPEDRITGHASVPLLGLVGFVKTVKVFAAGDSQTVCITIPVAEFQLMSVDGEYGIAPGAWMVTVGGAQPQLPLQSSSLLSRKLTFE
jgi:beta-glucosidase